ncbi:hypothetical protein [Nocardia sp. NBC_01327]|uniref:hypothetical protein n=1 Tax=Nocardia sp. NBC_01327 TaxID=2903593 RepID=UPI002E10E90A|nr:hypothetical protein OG326_24110 [Nocardia sp. NBC_01327]
MADRLSNERLAGFAKDSKRLGIHDAASAGEELLQLRSLVIAFTDSGACWHDHHGGCQAHGYLRLEPGELCPHAVAKQLIAEWDSEVKDHA